MSQGLFLDRAVPPSRDRLVAGLGERITLWDRLTGWIEATYGVVPDPLFSGKDAGWVIRYRRSGRSLVLLAPLNGALRAVVVIGPSVAGAVRDLELRPSTRAAFERARAYPDGRWLDLSVESVDDVEDVTRLIALKSPPPRRRRRPAVAKASA
jgi:hypothetical protein